MYLAQLLREGMAGEVEEDAPPSETQFMAQIMDLRILAAAYAIGCPFSVGNLVTPRSNCGIRGAGIPHIVVEVLGEPICNLLAETGTSNSYFGRRIDCRVICFSDVGNCMAPFWIESWQYEPYTGPMPEEH